MMPLHYVRCCISIDRELMRGFLIQELVSACTKDLIPGSKASRKKRQTQKEKQRHA